MPFRSLHHFASIMEAPIFSVYELYRDASHPAHALLLADLSSISEEQVEWFIAQSDIRHLLTRKDNVIEKKLLIFISLVSDQIDALRMRELTSVNKRPKPYDHPALTDVPIDRNAMVKCSDLQMIFGGFSKAGEAFVLLPCTNGNNSSYWIFETLFGIRRWDLLKVRLDPFMHEAVATFSPMMYKMQLYGTAFDWQRIKNLVTPEHTQFIAEFPSGRDIFRTDLVWNPANKELHFTCEEMPHKTAISNRGSRYFHAIFEKETGRLKHCDGAIRFYTDQEYDLRLEKHIKASEVTRVGKRIKVFQFDVPDEILPDEPITHQHFLDMVTTFFVWNYDVLGYFNPEQAINWQT